MQRSFLSSWVLIAYWFSLDAGFAPLVVAGVPLVGPAVHKRIAAQTAALPRPGLVVLGAVALGLDGPAIPVVFVTA